MYILQSFIEMKSCIQFKLTKLIRQLQTLEDALKSKPSTFLSTDISELHYIVSTLIDIRYAISDAQSFNECYYNDFHVYKALKILNDDFIVYINEAETLKTQKAIVKLNILKSNFTVILELMLKLYYQR